MNARKSGERLHTRGLRIPHIAHRRSSDGPRRMRPVGAGFHAWFTAVLVVAAFALPGLAYVAGDASYASGHATRRQELATRRAVTAVLNQDVTDSGSGHSGTVPAAVTWSAPGGAHGDGIAPVRPPGHTGQSVTIWVDGSGVPVQPPVTGSWVLSQAVSIGLLTALFATCALLLLYAVEQFTLTRVRLARWGREWRRIAPTWTAAY